MKRILQPTFQQKVYNCQITVDFSKTKKSVQCNIFDVLSENTIIFVRMWLFLHIKNILNLKQTNFSQKRGYLRMCNCVDIFQVINVYYTV